MTLRAEDLPIALRRRLGITAQRGQAGPRAPRSPGLPIRCQCGLEFKSEGRWEKHADEVRHTRMSLVLG